MSKRKANYKSMDSESNIFPSFDDVSFVEYGEKIQNESCFKLLLFQISRLTNEIQDLKNDNNSQRNNKIENKPILKEKENEVTLTRVELAKRWKVSIQTLKRREKEGILKPLVLGGSVRYEMVDIQEIEKEAKVTYA